MAAQAKYKEFSEASWGLFPALTLLNGGALILTALAFNASRNGETWAIPLFWLSLLIMFAPTAMRLSSSAIARRERIGLIVVLGLALYLVKALHSPLYFSLHDEFLHWRTAIDIQLTHFLFAENTILTVSPLYPGLEVVTTAFANLSGLPIYQAGLVTLGIARIAFMLALYLFYEYAGHSAQIGGIAALLYMGNSNFLFFDSQFSYESLALPIATTVLYAVMFRQRSGDRGWAKLFLLILPMIIMVAMTHHLTAYVLVGLLFLWALTALVLNRVRREWRDVGVIAVMAAVIVVGWNGLTGNMSSGYLEPVFRGGITELLRLITSAEGGRALFQSASGQDAAVWERVIGIAAVVFVLAALPFGVLKIWYGTIRHWLKRDDKIALTEFDTWHRYTGSPVACAFTLLVFLHPLMQGFRLTSAGWEIANRSSEFVFWAIAFIAAVGVLSTPFRRIPRPIWALGFTVWASVIFMGGVIAGWPPWARLPGSYLVSADSRSVEPQGILAATWAGEHLDPTQRIAADRINTLLLGTYGHLRPLTHQYDQLYIAPVFLSPQLGSYERGLIMRSNLRYALVDRRLSTELPRVGVYFEAGEPNSNAYTAPASLAALRKFDMLPGVDRIFDSGDIRIYDLGGFDANP